MQSKILLVLLVLVAASASAQTEMVAVVSKPVSRTLELPGELQPFLRVAVHARVGGYVERILVDRGTFVKQGQLLAEISAPEIKSRMAEALSRVDTAEADRAQAAAQLAGAQSALEHLKKAAETPGVIAGNEVIQAEKLVEAGKALVASREQSRKTAQAIVETEKELQAYLKITAPFDGMVTERLLHPGALAGPPTNPALLVIEQVSHLRLVVPVPESAVGGIVKGASVSFQVPAHPERTYSGTVARLAHTLDEKTRTMPVELDVVNRDDSLAPGMYPTVRWPVRQRLPALYVPKTSVVTTNERTFVIRENEGKAVWVNVRKGAADGDLLEVSGEIKAGDRVVRRGTDELRDGAALVSAKK
jgi:membrane fusion protein (multidrug efflux system)